MSTKNLNILKGDSTEKPEIQFISSVIVFDLQEATTLHCTADGEELAIHNISFMKNGKVISPKTVSDKILTYMTNRELPRNVCGLYYCIASNTAGTASEPILLKHKGD